MSQTGSKSGDGASRSNARTPQLYLSDEDKEIVIKVITLTDSLFRATQETGKKRWQIVSDLANDPDFARDYDDAKANFQDNLAESLLQGAVTNGQIGVLAAIYRRLVEDRSKSLVRVEDATSLGQTPIEDMTDEQLKAVALGQEPSMQPAVQRNAKAKKGSRKQQYDDFSE